MLRLLVLIAFRLLVAFIGVGLLLSRPWGWSEYASPALYVVYYQMTNRQAQYSVVNADGSSPAQKLTWAGSLVTQVDCSPDGRTFAFLTGDAHLHVITAAGLGYDSAVDRLYTTVNVANDGTTALFDPQAGRLLVNSRGINLAAPVDPDVPMDRVDISAQGQVLWSRNFQTIQVMSLDTGQVTPYVSRGYSGTWLAPGQIFAYADQVTDEEGIGLGGGQYLMDTVTQKVVRIGYWTLSSPLSPDGTQVAASVPLSSMNHVAQVVVYPVLSDEQGTVLTHDTQTAARPVCFLTFRPQMLIGASS